MRRAALAATVLVVGALLASLAAVDWGFLSRAWRLAQLDDIGEWPQELYRPVARVRGGDAAYFDEAPAAERSIAQAELQQAADWAEANASVALLVLHRGRVQLERYWEGMDGDSLYPVRAITRSLLALAYGHAVADGKLDLDAPVALHLHEWRDDPRGALTPRQLMQNVSGLEQLPINALEIPPGLSTLGRMRFVLASRSAKNTRLTLSSDFAAAALSFDAVHPPGERFAFSNANAQLMGVLVERAVGQDLERYFEEKLWRYVAAAAGEFYLDRVDGMPAAYCCLRATPRDLLRVGSLLVSDGMYGGRRVLPEGWIDTLRQTSTPNPLYGLQLWSGRASAGRREYGTNPPQGVVHGENYLADDVIWLEGGGGRTVWAIPSRELVIVRLGRSAPGWDASVLPNLLIRGIDSMAPVVAKSREGTN